MTKAADFKVSAISHIWFRSLIQRFVLPHDHQAPFCQRSPAQALRRLAPQSAATGLPSHVCLMGILSAECWPSGKALVLKTSDGTNDAAGVRIFCTPPQWRGGRVARPRFAKPQAPETVRRFESCSLRPCSCSPIGLYSRSWVTQKRVMTASARSALHSWVEHVVPAAQQ